MSKYRVIIADPPWAYNNQARAGARKHYPIMSIDNVLELPVESLAHDDCVLLLWCPWAMLPDGLRVIDAWGFTFVTGFPWVKVQRVPQTALDGGEGLRPVFGAGWWVRGCSEPILIAKRGNVKPPDRTRYSWAGIISSRFKHSRKPRNLYEYAESFPGPYVELFAREQRRGWSAHGFDITGGLDNVALHDD